MKNQTNADICAIASHVHRGLDQQEMLWYDVTNSAAGVTSTFAYGDLIANLIDFIIIAFVVFIMYKILSRSKILGVEDKTKK
ncbi:MscL family protein [Nitrososphaera sp.]|uniref:MscL family protein n=1 Tax=Nitrososphaera sp. TaxID=1971748 RepID=UPI002ED9386E